MDNELIVIGLIGLVVGVGACWVDARLDNLKAYFRIPLRVLTIVFAYGGIGVFYTGIFNALTGREASDFFTPLFIPIILTA